MALKKGISLLKRDAFVLYSANETWMSFFRDSENNVMALLAEKQADLNKQATAHTVALSFISIDLSFRA